ncbi:MAG: hypothetical protein KAJ18_03290 [Candidatus Omnitrophica bacterium]|nr:hypothetical protein [Candidatus Omnitrophota bacterium]
MKNKKWLKVLVVVVVCVFALGVIKDVLIKTAVTVGAKQVLGTPVKIGKFHLGILTQKIYIKDFKMYQPEGFPEGVLIDIPEINIKCNVLALLKGKIHLPLIVFDLKEMVLVRNTEGALNLDALKIAEKEEEVEEPKDVSQEKKEKKTSKETAMQIDVMTLKIGKLVQKDYSKGDQPVVSVMNIDKDKTYKDIKSAAQLARILLVETAGPAVLKGAKIYAATAILGVGFLPAGVVGVLIAKDRGTAEFDVGLSEVFSVSKQIVAELGKIKSVNEAKGLIKAKVNGSDVAINIIEQEKNKTKVTVSARKMMIPKPKIAEGVLYEISEKLK